MKKTENTKQIMQNGNDKMNGIMIMYGEEWLISHLMVMKLFENGRIGIVYV